MTIIKLHTLAAAVALLALTSSACAAVTAEEAAALKSSLTPMGAERAANKAGTIPAWDGGLKSGAQSGKFPADPYPQDQQVLRITAANMEQYQDKLGEGTKALLKRYPSYAVSVFPTRRSAAFPQAVYDNTARNATNAKLEQEGLTLSGAYGGVPFPIPKTGLEVIWNHILRPNVESSEFGARNFMGSADGKRTLTTRADNNNQSSYYISGGSAEKWNKDIGQGRLLNTDPPFKAGEALVVRDSADPANSRQAWQYLVGQKRVRRAPTVGYDTPDFVASGANYLDEVRGFWGGPDRYDWKLVGKQDVYIPYNNNRFFLTPESDAFVPFHANPDKLRWELHRVWVLDATVKAGKRHVVPKRRYYLDEDTWAVALVDGFDAEGKLWRTSQVVPFSAPSVPMTLTDTTLVYNLQASTYSCIQCMHGEYWRAVALKPASFFTGEAMGSESSR
jgi:hypothetical protein